MSHNRVAVTRLEPSARLTTTRTDLSVDRPPPSQGGDLPQRVAAHGRRPAYHVLRSATGRNPGQRFWLVFAASARIRFAADCHGLQPRGSTKAPFDRVVINGYVSRRLPAQLALEAVMSTTS